jgi:hypothetical protein
MIIRVCKLKLPTQALSSDEYLVEAAYSGLFWPLIMRCQMTAASLKDSILDGCTKIPLEDFITSAYPSNAYSEP